MKNTILTILLITYCICAIAQDTITFDFEKKEFSSNLDYLSIATYDTSGLVIIFKKYTDEFEDDKIKLVNESGEIILDSTFSSSVHNGITIDSLGKINGTNHKLSLPFTIEITISGESTPFKAMIGYKNPFYDAIAFTKNINNDNVKLRILKKYNPSASLNTSFFQDNTFLTNQIKKNISNSLKLKDISDSPEIKNIKLIGSAQGFGSTDFSSNAIESIGTFIANRFKQELNIAFLEKFREMLSKYEELEALFPKSLEILQNNEPYNFTTFLQTLRDAFNEDLNNLTDNLRSFLQDKYNANPIDVLAYLLTINEIADGVVDNIEKKIKLYEIINKIEEYEYLDKLNSKEGQVIGNSFKLLALVSRNITNQSQDNWITPKDLKILIKPENADLRELFIGFIYEKEKVKMDSIKFNSTSITSWLKDNNERIFTVNKYIFQIGEKVNDLVKISKQKFVKENGQEDKFLKFYKYAKGVTAIISKGLEGALDLKILINKDTIIVNNLRKRYIPTTSSGLDMIHYIRNKEYGLAINSAYEIIKLYLDEEEPNIKTQKDLVEKRIKDLDSLLNQSPPLNEKIKLETEKKNRNDELLKLNNLYKKVSNKTNKLIVPSYILKYGNFIASMAVAKDADEMLKILETAALPVGSYRIKRNSLFDISLNAYAGGFVGVEWFQGDKTMLEVKGVDKTKLALGFTAPVGINFSWGKRKKITQEDIDGKTKFGRNFKFINESGNPKILKGVSHSLFLSIIDVGAITSFKLTSDSTKTLPDFTWENVLAPGVFYVRGFRNSPLSLNIGFQYGPQIRSLKNDQTVIDKDALRSFSIRAGLTVDIPIFSFFTRNEKRVKRNKKE